MKKIDKVVITNFKKIEKVSIDLKGNHLLLLGMNGAGKSSILDAIKRTFGLKAKIQEPIRQGADGATIRNYVMDDDKRYCLEEKFSGKTGKSRFTFYKVGNGHEDELNPPLERFHEIFGRPIDFTPLIDMDGEKQFDYLKENLGFDLSMFEHNYDAVYDDRTAVGRDIATLKAAINGHLQVYDTDLEKWTEPKEFESIQAQMIDIEPLLKNLAQAESRAKSRAQVEAKETEWKSRIESLRLEIQLCEEGLSNCEKWKQEHPPIDAEPILLEIDSARETNKRVNEELRGIEDWNRNVEKVRNFKLHSADLEEKQKKYNELSDKLRGIDSELKNRIKEINLSEIVPGLQLVYEVGEDPKKPGKTKVLKSGLEYEGLAFNRSQHSYGRLLKAIIKLAAHFNADKLNFIPIGDWNLLDEESQKEVLDFARENPDLNIQFAIEKVDSGREIRTQIIEV